MAIKVQFPTGKSTAAVSGLYQWDYGQELEIECEEIGSEMLEVHFACNNMTEAVVRVCYFTDGIGTVEIPDECLEQTGAITAWLYRVDSTQGHTIKTITISITARTRPSKTRDIPTNFEDKYGQLMEEINKAVDALEKGDVTVAKALTANNADHASTAGNVQSTSYAETAGSANKASAIAFPKQETVTITNGKGKFSNALIANNVYVVFFNYFDDGGNVCETGIFIAGNADAGKSVCNSNHVITVSGMDITIEPSVSGTLFATKLGGLGI